MRTPLPILLCVMAIGLLADKSAALDGDRRLSQYAHTVWRSQEGYFAGPPSSITQTRDGYIWVGTSGGLLRFDGVRFTKWTSPDADHALPGSVIVSLLGSQDGSLWVGTGNGLARWLNGTLTTYSDVQGYINSIVGGEAGDIWVARTRDRGLGPLCKIVETAVHCYGKPDGIEEPYGQSVAIDADRNVWMGGQGSLVQRKGNSSPTFRPESPLAGGHPTNIVALAAGDHHSLWVGFIGSGPGLGLQQLQGGNWKALITPSFDSSALRISSLLLDHQQSLWVGTLGDGIYRIRGNSVQHFGMSDGLSGDSVTNIFEDAEHNIWVATTGGVDSFRDLAVVSYSKVDGITGDGVNSAVAAPDGSTWVATVGGLDRISRGEVSSIRQHHGLPGEHVGALLVDHQGRLWVGVDDDLYLYEGGRFKSILDVHGQHSGIVVHMVEDADGSIWAKQLTSPQGLLLIRDNKIVARFAEPNIHAVTADPQGGAWINRDNDIYHVSTDGAHRHIDMPADIEVGKIQNGVTDANGVLWLVAREGILRLDGDNLRLLRPGNGLPCASYGAPVFDDHGDLWLAQKCGIVKIARASLLSWIKNPEAKVSTLTLNEFDGVQVGYTNFGPAASRGIDNRLWFVNGSTVQMFDPGNLHLNSVPPPVHIEQLLADHKVVSRASNMRLPPLTRDLEFDYTALSFVMPQRVMFRYKLEGYDTEFQEAGTRRSAFYTDLKPGSYRFLVSACNNSGVWSVDRATLSFIILPAWYQTVWFRILCATAFLLAVYFLYLLRLRQQAARLKLGLDERLEERTRIARDLHDTLLQTIQGSKLIADVAEEHVSDPDKIKHSLKTLSEWLGRAAMEGRTALESLRATEAADLGSALRSIVEEYGHSSAMQVFLSIDGLQREMNPVIRDEVFWIAYEAIRNASNHSQASRVDVELSIAEGMTLLVQDNGRGIPDETLGSGKPGRFGLKGMRERAAKIGGQLTITSSPGSGTEIRLTIPGRAIFATAKTVRGRPPSRLDRLLSFVTSRR